jgi:hypothetical protein
MCKQQFTMVNCYRGCYNISGNLIFIRNFVYNCVFQCGHDNAQLIFHDNNIYTLKHNVLSSSIRYFLQTDNQRDPLYIYMKACMHHAPKNLTI